MKPYRTLDLSQANAKSASSATARERTLNHTSVPAMTIIIAHAVGASHQRSSTENDSSISVVINHLATLWLTRHSYPPLTGFRSCEWDFRPTGHPSIGGALWQRKKTNKTNTKESKKALKTKYAKHVMERDKSGPVLED
tara:strand:- start:231 stop:647 length:417 start_codon:yes stop_codon:yes gene_type:complete